MTRVRRFSTITRPAFRPMTEGQDRATGAQAARGRDRDGEYRSPGCARYPTGPPEPKLRTMADRGTADTTGAQAARDWPETVYRSPSCARYPRSEGAPEPKLRTVAERLPEPELRTIEDERRTGADAAHDSLRTHRSPSCARWPKEKEEKTTGRSPGCAQPAAGRRKSRKNETQLMNVDID